MQFGTNVQGGISLRGFVTGADASDEKNVKLKPISGDE